MRMTKDVMMIEEVMSRLEDDIEETAEQITQEQDKSESARQIRRIAREIALIVQYEEREAAAEICDEDATKHFELDQWDCWKTATDLADAIRNQSDEE
jgi:histidinol dehydrogenase